MHKEVAPVEEQRYYQPELETMPREEMAKLQNERFMKQLKRVYENVPYYRAKMEEKGVTPDDIKKAVANYFGIKVSELESEKRSKNIAFPRQVAIYLIREHTNYSLPQMGRLFGGRDHTTIRHSYEKISEEMKTDKELQDTIDVIYSSI